MGSREPTRVYVADTEVSERMGLAGHLDVAADFSARFGDRLVASAAEVEAGIGDAEIVCAALGRISAAAIDRAPELRLIVKCGIGIDNIDVVAARRRGIPILRTREGVEFRGVAEYVIGAVIAINRRLPEFDRAVRDGDWDRERQNWTGRIPALTGKVLGIVGVGSIGSELARLAAAHGMRVLGSDPYLDPAVAAGLGVELTSKEDLLERADVVSLHLLLSEDTRGFIGDDELSRMKSTALLVNTARGPIVDQEALIRALESGRIAAAAVDVYEEEPLPSDSRLIELDNCMLSPHLSGCTDYDYAEIGTAAMGLLRMFVEGRSLPACSVVDRGSGLPVA